jgi:hypothetical protein
MAEGDGAGATYELLAREVARLRVLVALLGVALVTCVVWLAARAPVLPPVLSAERLEIVEADGSLAFVLANSERPVAATLDGRTLMEGQEEERRGVPSFVFFDGRGDEVGGMLTGARTTPDGYSATRHLSLDGYKQDQTIVLAHYQDPEGSSAGLRISDRPLDVSLADAFGALGLEMGATREDMQAAVQAIPEVERAEKLRELFGVQRLFLGSTRSRNASLVMNDGKGRPRILIDVPDDGEPSIQILDAEGVPVLRLPS